MKQQKRLETSYTALPRILGGSFNLEVSLNLISFSIKIVKYGGNIPVCRSQYQRYSLQKKPQILKSAKPDLNFSFQKII